MITIDDREGQALEITQSLDGLAGERVCRMIAAALELEAEEHVRSP
jgi:hypothetical protein